LPPVIGWAAATNAIGIESLVLFLIIFLWTPPHFWALALFKVGDYAAAGIPMMPNVAGEASTRRQIFVYSLLLAPIGVLPWAALRKLVDAQKVQRTISPEEEAAYRPRQFPRVNESFCMWGAVPDIPEFRKPAGGKAQS